MENKLIRKYIGTTYEIKHVCTLPKFVAMLVNDSLCDTEGDLEYEDELIAIEQKALKGEMTEEEMIDYIEDYGWTVENNIFNGGM